MSRGQGRVYRPMVLKHASDCTVRKPERCSCPRFESQVWWLDYSIGGRRHQESSGTTSRAAALELLRQRIGDRRAGKVIGRPDRIVFAEYEKADDGTDKLVGGLRAGLERHYRREGNRSLRRAQQALDHLEAFFGAETRALAFTKTRVAAYIDHRRAQGHWRSFNQKHEHCEQCEPQKRCWVATGRGTVRYEVAILNAAFSVAVEDEVLAVQPMFKLPPSGAARSGFYSEGDVAALLLELPDPVRPLIRFAYMTGWRRSEVLSLTWDRIEWEGELIRLTAEQAAKHGGARAFPFGLAPDLKALLQERWAARDGIYVFHRDGHPIKDFRRAWEKARTKAGLAGRVLHDFRRTAARDLRRAGVSEGEAMKLCGWKTRAMFDRYNIIDEADLANAVAKRFNGKTTGKLGTPTDSQSSLSSSPAISAA